MTTLATQTVPGFPAEIAAMLRLEAVGADQGLVSIGYDRGGRRHVTAETLLPSLAEAEAMLADRERLAGFVAQGVWAMPAAFRPALPRWIETSAVARRALAMRTRVGAVATKAAAAADQADLPWAA